MKGLVACTYEDSSERVQRLARALQAIGIKPGHWMASVARSSNRHLELYFPVP